MKIAVEGCMHGDLDKVYETIRHLEKTNDTKIDLLLCCGDFQAVRNERDMESLNVPPKYREMKSFWKYYSGREVAPVPTIFIGGNHEASNYLWELYYGGWAAPNIYFLGFSGVVKFGNIRIGGLSGIYNARDYRLGHYERPPYNERSIRSVYHVREYDVHKLMEVTESIDVFLSHDWPVGITDCGNWQQLVRHKRHFEKEIKERSLGSRPAAELLEKLRPSYWFSAHLHCKFSALVQHGEGGPLTRFLALDKCLPGRKFLQIVEIESEPGPYEIQYDEEWLAITRKFNSILPLTHRNAQFSDTQPETLQDCRHWVRSKLQGRGTKPFEFARTAPPFDPTQSKLKFSFPECHRNPQTEAFLQLLELPYLLDSTSISGELIQSPSMQGQRGSLAENSEEIPIDDVDELEDLAEVNAAEMKPSTSGLGQQQQQQQGQEGEKKCLNSELWHACAGPLVSLPTVGSRVVYFPQGHSEQVAATTNREVDGHIPNYPSLPPQLICQLHNVTMHADIETDEVYAQMTLQPLTPQEQKDTFLPMDLGMPSKQPTNYFCKTLTASDTSTHGGFSVPRRAAEKVFPPLDFSQQPPAQELIARDLHDAEWKFRHIFRGQPKRHLLTTGWSVFVSAKRLVAGDSVIFIWNEKNQLLLGIRRATRPQTVMPSSVLSSDSMHIGLLAAAAHAAATNSCFTIFYNPRASPSEFVIPLSKYVKAVFHTRVSVGMRFRMLFETEESSVRRYMGTITGISDLDPVRWRSSHWRSVKVGWDESTAGERQPRVSLWEIEPLTTFPMYPSLFPLRLKRPWHPGPSSLHDGRDEATNGLMWLRGGTSEQGLQSLNFQAVNMIPWMQQRLDPTMLGSDQNQRYQAMLAASLQNMGSGDPLRQQYMQFQQPHQYIQQSPNHSPLLQLQQQQQAMRQSLPANMLQVQNQIPAESLPGHLLQPQLNNHSDDQAHQQPNYHDALQIQTEQLHRPNIPSPSFSKTEFIDPGAKFSTSTTAIPNMLGSLCPEGGGNMLDFTRPGQSAITEQLPQHSWAPKYAHQEVNAFTSSLSLPRSFAENDPSLESANCNPDIQNPTLFGVNIDSSGLLLPTTVPRFPASSVGNDVPSMPLGDSGFQNSLYSCVQESSELLHTAGQIDAPTPSGTFVKVYKSGSVGRSLDISRFSSYHELREELAQMFGIEGKLENPHRSGWQLVFVDRENDVLLLGDDPWEAFVNNVWYIKILSPEDVLKMGEQGVESSTNAGQRMSAGGL